MLPPVVFCVKRFSSSAVRKLVMSPKAPPMACWFCERNVPSPKNFCDWV